MIFRSDGDARPVYGGNFSLPCSLLDGGRSQILLPDNQRYNFVNKNPKKKSVRAYCNIEIILVTDASIFSFVLEDHAITNTTIPAA